MLRVALRLTAIKFGRVQTLTGTVPASFALKSLRKNRHFTPTPLVNNRARTSTDILLNSLLRKK